MRWFVFLMCVGLIGCTGATGADGVDSIAEIVEMANNLRNTHAMEVIDVWCYVSDDDDNTTVQSFGTGTKTVTGTIITAHHVIDDCSFTSYFNESGFIGTGDSWEQFGERDIAEISSIKWTLAGEALPGVVPHFEIVPVVGEVIYALHYPGISLRRDVQVSAGRVVDDNVNSSLTRTLSTSWKDAFTSDYVATGGSSGAPVFDRGGNWFAIHVGGYRSNLDLNYSLPLRQ